MGWGRGVRGLWTGVAQRAGVKGKGFVGAGGASRAPRPAPARGGARGRLWAAAGCAGGAAGGARKGCFQRTCVSGPLRCKNMSSVPWSFIVSFFLPCGVKYGRPQGLGRR